MLSLKISPGHREDEQQRPSLHVNRYEAFISVALQTWRRDGQEVVAEVDKRVNIGPVPEVVALHLFK